MLAMVRWWWRWNDDDGWWWWWWWWYHHMEFETSEVQNWIVQQCEKAPQKRVKNRQQYKKESDQLCLGVAKKMELIIKTLLKKRQIWGLKKWEELLAIESSVLRLWRISILFLPLPMIRSTFSIHRGVNNRAISSEKNKYRSTENIFFFTKAYLSIPIFQKRILRYFNKIC